jgi:hypothetical protein
MVILYLHLFHVDNSTCKMQAMVDGYKDIPHIEYVLPSCTPLCFCVTFGVICIVECDKTNVKEQGWLSSMYLHAIFFILFLQVIHIIINFFEYSIPDLRRCTSSFGSRFISSFSCRDSFYIISSLLDLDNTDGSSFEGNIIICTTATISQSQAKNRKLE